ncbi:mediator of RNA polymerase II transcription subunit 15-like [Aphis craccivora]|uniref:Mediator of RNA polymerase II transcription subunit 15-like n=1 Tax=Aphis craccivora TaxID=307492 RepID=A0A6G0YDW1_APHCR|nr:mediator of RNA polymerase II transcription subunit 15-like [Aphis craccivora]
MYRAKKKTIQNERIKHDGEKSINEKTDVIWTVKRKIIKEERKKRQNARIRSLVYPKSPLMVFHELFSDVRIHIQQHHGDAIHNITSYTATLEIDGQTYSGNHTSNTEAKQKVCQHFFRDMLANKINEPSEKNKEYPEIDVGDNDTKFPWSYFTSLAMHNLINQREKNPVVKTHNYVQYESTFIKPQLKVNYHVDNARMHRLVYPKSPLMVFHELFRDVPFNLQQHHGDASHKITSYTATLEIDEQTHSETHISKNEAKQKACQHFFRDMLANKINEPSEKNKEFPRMEIKEKKGPPQEDFPWSNFASLAMYKLLNQWAVKPNVISTNYA